MKALGLLVGMLGLATLVQALLQSSILGAIVGIVALVCAVTTFRSANISSFLRIFVGVFSTETLVFGLAELVARIGFWPSAFAADAPLNHCR